VGGATAYIWDVRVGAVWRVLHGTYAWAARVGVYVRRERALIALDPEVQGPGGMGNHNKGVRGGGRQGAGQREVVVGVCVHVQRGSDRVRALRIVYAASSDSVTCEASEAAQPR